MTFLKLLFCEIIQIEQKILKVIVDTFELLN